MILKINIILRSPFNVLHSVLVVYQYMLVHVKLIHVKLLKKKIKKKSSSISEFDGNFLF